MNGCTNLYSHSGLFSDLCFFSDIRDKIPLVEMLTRTKHWFYFIFWKVSRANKVENHAWILNDVFQKLIVSLHAMQKQPYEMQHKLEATQVQVLQICTSVLWHENIGVNLIRCQLAQKTKNWRARTKVRGLRLPVGWKSISLQRRRVCACALIHITTLALIHLFWYYDWDTWSHANIIVPQ